MRAPRVLWAALVTAGLLALAGVAVPSQAQAPTTRPVAPARTRAPLAGVRIALDPGHQLGNHNFPRRINRVVRAGRHFRKPCNTTGTAIPHGLPEATVVWRIALQARARLEHLGAKVFLTRRTNSQRRWGPCVSTRGRFGRRVHARLIVSIHADGSLDRANRGFHVILPTRGHLMHPWIVRPSRRLAKALRRGFGLRHIPRSNYIGGGTALSPRNDLGTLDMSGVPAAMLEIGNVWNRSDAHRMSTVHGRHRYAHGIVSGIRHFLRR